jgi:hypothetical protein
MEAVGTKGDLLMWGTFPGVVTISSWIISGTIISGLSGLAAMSTNHKSRDQNELRVRMENLNVQ